MRFPTATGAPRAVIALCILAACGSEPNVQPTARATAQATAAVPDSAWRLAAAKRVYFGHQSVGANILDGVRELMAERPGVALQIVRGDDPSAVSGPAIVESYLGENGDPESKGAAFAAVLERGFGAAGGGIALYKHCYLDIGAGTDVRRMFERYRARSAELKARYPGLTLAHVTVPLTSGHESALRGMVKKAIGKPTAADLNAKRNAFNALLREAYAGREPLFDLAAVESSRRDGSRSYVTRGSDTVYTLAPEYTDDGGHLNAVGRRAAAGAFLSFLAGL